MADQNADSDLQRLEREAEHARARLQVTIAEIKDPQTIENAKKEVTDHAVKLKDQVVDYIMGAKDDALGQMRDTRQRQTSEFSRKLQRTAIENPIPVLLIGAGIGWHLYKKPPITTALLAAGAYGLVKNWNGSQDERLWRDPYGPNASGYVPGGVAGYGYDDTSDVAGVTERVKTAAAHVAYQAEDALTSARETIAGARQSAGDMASQTVDRVKDVASQAKGQGVASSQQAVDRASAATDSLREAGENLKGQISSAYTAATDRAQDLARNAMDRMQPALDRVQPAVDAVRPAVDRVKPLFDEDHRGQLGMLLVLAGAGAFAGSLLRSTETGRRWTETARDTLSDNWEHVRDRAAGARPSDWREQAAELPGRVQGAARDAASRVSDSTAQWRSAASERTADLRERGVEFGRSARDASADHPLLLSAIGLAVGAVLGGMIRQSSGERAALGETAKALREGAGEAVRETMQTVESRVRGAAEGVLEATGLSKAGDSIEDKASEARRNRVSA
jgi:hypothetical protein